MPKFHALQRVLMNYYEVAIVGYFLDALTYESEKELEIHSEVLVELGKKGEVKGIVLKKVDKPAFDTKPILQSTNRLLSKSQRELAAFISSYSPKAHTCAKE